MDPREDVARSMAAEIGDWSPGTRAYCDLAAMLGDGGLDAVIDLAPAPRHSEVNQAVLEAGLHLYAEKPLASTLADANRRIDTAAARGRMFLCALASQPRAGSHG